MRRSFFVAVAVLALQQALALVAAAHNCSSPADCEQTAGYNGIVATVGGVLAILAGMLGTQLGGPMDPATVKPTTAGGAQPVAPPLPPNAIWDPWSNKPLTTWDPTKFGPDADGNKGNPGDVWFGGHWISPDDARERIKAGVDADHRRAIEDQQFADDSHRISDQWMRDRERTLQQEADDEARRRKAQDDLNRIQEIARQRGDDDIWKRTLDNGYGPNGQIDPDYVDRLKNTLRTRITQGFDDTPAPPTKSWIQEGTENTINDALHNPIVRIGTDALTGGTAEIYFTSQTAWDAMHHAADDAASKGKDIDFTDAFRSGMGGVAREKLPINTIETIYNKGTDATWKDVGGSIIKDLGTIPGVVETGRNIGSSISQMNAGGSVGDVLTAKADPLNLFGQPKDPAKWPGEQYDGPLSVQPRNIKGMPPGTSVDPDEFGIPTMNGRQIKMVAEQNGVDVDVRPTTPYAGMRLDEGDLPKPMSIKAKSMNELDPYLGADPANMGRVAYFKPTMPDTSGMEPDLADAIGKRFTQRMDEFNKLSGDMKDLVGSGQIRLDPNGTVIGPGGKYFTGDHDIFSITDPSGAPVSDAVKARVIQQLQGGPANVQHGALEDWQLKPTDPHYGDNLTMKTNIENDHVVGGNALIKFGANGRTPTSSNFVP